MQVGGTSLDHDHVKGFDVFFHAYKFVAMLKPHETNLYNADFSGHDDAVRVRRLVWL